MKKLVTVLLALGLVGVVYAETRPLRGVVNSIEEIDDWGTRLDAWDDAGDEYGPALLNKLREGEELRWPEENEILNWHVVNRHRNRVDLELLREVLSLRTGTYYTWFNRRLAFNLALHPEVDDAEVIAAVGHLEGGAIQVVDDRDWDSPEGRLTFIEEWLEPHAQGSLFSEYKAMFNRYVQYLPVEDALPVLEDEIRASLIAEVSPERDEWIKSLRTQRVIMRDLAGE